jgi:hypothetical protein
MSISATVIIAAESIANGVTRYIELPVREGRIGAQVAWKDATSSATITLELTSFREAAAEQAGAAGVWKDSGLSFVGPAGVGADALLINVENCRQPRARLKIVAAAATFLTILDGTAP